MKDEVTAFQLGTSTVVTIPKRMGIKPGQKLKIKKEKQKITIKAKKEMTKEEIHKFIESLAGGLNFKKSLTPKQLNKLFEKSYENVLPRR